VKNREGKEVRDGGTDGREENEGRREGGE